MTRRRTANTASKAKVRKAKVTGKKRTSHQPTALKDKHERIGKVRTHRVMVLER